jgi:hypothetical protein
VSPKRTSTTTTVTRLGRPALLLVVAVALIATSCGGKSSGKPAARPTTAARLQIVEPTPNQTTGPDLTLRLDLIGATVVAPSQGTLRPDQGHIHVSLDGQLVSMAYGTTQELHGLAPGPHSVQAEFVAIDHAPFADRVVAAVLFRVGP